MNRRYFFGLVVVIGIMFFSGCVDPDAPSTAKADKPNILYIMIDDLGWMDLACQGSTEYHTPNIDRLARQGMRFTDAYSAAPVCSPTRAAAMTGLAPARLRITTHIPDRWSFYYGNSLGPGESVNHLEPGYTTIAERLKKDGYGTAFIGKWHLSGTKWSDENRIYLPENQGFDINIGGNHQGGPGGKGSFFDPYSLPNLKGRKPGQYLPDRLAEEAIDFIKKQKAADKPFFVCLWNYTVHWPVEATESLYKKYAAGEPNLHQKYQAMVEGTDIAVGKVLAEMDAMGITEETLVVFTSDNGPFVGDNAEITSAKPLKKSKGYLSEGGIRVPLIIRWPGKVKPDTLCSEPVVTMDFVPTFLDAVGVDYKANEFDGETLVPLLTQSGKPARDAIYFHFPHYAFHRDNQMGSVIRSGDYKLIKFHKTGDIELYNLADDLGETKNLAKALPKVAGRLSAQLDRWLIETKAAMPRPTKDIPDDELYGKRE
ncbi:MAG: sulfatase [Phycisphaerae bacterium]|nr:sulfatase [Phycisphaerae bacterium]